MTNTFLRNFLIVTLSILVIGFVAYTVYQVFTPVSEIPVTTDPTVNWKTYKNSDHGYSVRYPRDLELEEGFDRQNFLQMTSLGLRDKERGDRVFYVRATDIGWKLFMPIIYHARLIKDSEKKVLIDDVEGTQFKIEDLPKTKYILVERNNVLYEFIGEGDLFDQVLATFEFIEVIKPKQRQVSFTRPTVEALPQQVRDWVKNSLKLDMTRFANVMELEGKQYLFIASGVRSSVDSHLVEITDVVIVEQEEIVVKANFSKLSPDQSTIQMPDNPYDLVYIEATGLQARFVPIGDDEYISITSITGIDHLPAVVAQSRGIKVFTPTPNEVVDRNFSVSGVANVFEATVLYRLLDAKQDKLVDGFAAATALASNFTREPVIPSDATIGLGWGYFTFDLIVPETVVAGTDLILQLYTTDAKNSHETNLVIIPLKFESR